MVRVNETDDVPCSPEIEDWDFLSVGHLSSAGAWSRVIKIGQGCLGRTCGIELGYSLGDSIRRRQDVTPACPSTGSCVLC